MNSLYNARCSELAVIESDDVKKWSSIFNMITWFVCLVDRTNNIKMPFRFKTYEPFRMPRDLSDFNMTYDQCCQKRCEEILKISYAINKPIYIFYSGGIDSTMVLISFMKYLSKTDFDDRITVVLTNNSVYENPSFYYDFIRKRCKTVSSENFNSFFSNDIITVGGEHNDQLFGSDILLKIYYYSNSDGFHSKYNRDFILPWFKRSLNDTEANFWYDLLDHHIKSYAPCEVTTNFHFFWWYNFCFKWQNVYFRMLNSMPENRRNVVTEDFLKNNYHHFFNSESFQKWSMLNHHLKIGNTWTEYKLEAKNLIYEYTKDDTYRFQKIKMNSLVRLWHQRKMITAIDSNCRIYDKIDAMEFYDPNNSFK